ncbi:MAG: thiamine kinase-like enzyme [Gammaproteobacteria bacterium]|jgi:thiamine kinase-like enzyme
MKELNLVDTFRQIPMLENFHPSDFQITVLGGLSNHNYRLISAQVDWILRIPRAETNRYIDRQVESYNRSLAFGLGLSNQCIWEGTNGISLSITVVDGKILTSNQLAELPNMQRLIDNLHRLHRSAINFQGTVDVIKLIDRYFKLVSDEKREPLKLKKNQLLSEIDIERLGQLPLVPSHNDLNPENLILDSSNRLWFIDWEFSAMANPCWDLAIICHYGEFTNDQTEQFLMMYCVDRSAALDYPVADFRRLLALLNECWLCAFGIE